MTSPLFTITEAAAYLHMTRSMFFDSAHKELPAVRRGQRYVRYTKAALDQWIADHTDESLRGLSLDEKVARINARMGL